MRASPLLPPRSSPPAAVLMAALALSRRPCRRATRPSCRRFLPHSCPASSVSLAPAQKQARPDEIRAGRFDRRGGGWGRSRRSQVGFFSGAGGPLVAAVGLNGSDLALVAVRPWLKRCGSRQDEAASLQQSGILPGPLRLSCLRSSVGRGRRQTGSKPCGRCARVAKLLSKLVSMGLPCW